MEQKRKTKTSSKVKYRYNKKNYKRYEFRLRFDTEKNLINYLENQNCSINNYLKILLSEDYKKNQTKKL